jgi:hypothetical protein
MARIENWNPPNLTHTKATFSWNVPYAAAVHEGEITPSGSVLPARPWTDHVVANIDAEREFASAYKDTDDLNNSFQSFVQVYFGEFQDAIASEIWSWPRPTRRTDGSVVTSPRSIVDTGELLRSQEVELE